MESAPLVTNVKVSVKCLPISLHTVSEKAFENGFRVRVSNNFIVLKKEFCSSIFKNRSGETLNHVNVTKIRNLCDVEKVFRELEIVGVYCRPEHLVIDNITGQLNTHARINIRKLVSSDIQYLLNKYSDGVSVTVKYNNEKFPGAFLRLFKRGKRLGTSIVFHSGKIVFVGCKREADLKCLALLTRVIILMKS